MPKHIYHNLSENIRHAWQHGTSVKTIWVMALAVIQCALLLGCARMGNPDGGWYDETPPHVVSATPADRAVGVSAKKVRIYFDEYIKVENASEKVVVSPPQLEVPEIKSMGKMIEVKLLDSLKANTTYTIDFSDAISDNNEGNPLGNYTYSFSTGTEIDTMEVSGSVLNAEDLEPIKGILVGLYAVNDSLVKAHADSISPYLTGDSIFSKEPLLRVSRTDSRGRFVIKGVAPGHYRVYALGDADGDYRYTQKSEQIAFNHDVIIPSFKPDVRQDTLWKDTLHIKSIERVHYTHFLPDDIVLRAFTATVTDRFFLKQKRDDADHFTLFFTYGHDSLPVLRGLNYDSNDAFIIESNDRKDTITYWLRDTLLVNQDSLLTELTYMATDTLGNLVSRTDTINILPKRSYEKRMKDAQKELEDWQKQQEKAKKKGRPYDSVMPPKKLVMRVDVPSALNPNENLHFVSPVPLEDVDTAKIHLYSMIDSLWYRSKFIFRPVDDSPVKRHDVLVGDTIADYNGTFKHQRRYELLGEWRPGVEYSLEIDSAAFADIYGHVSDAIKHGFKVKTNDMFSTLLINIPGFENKHLVVQLLDNGDKPVQIVRVDNGRAEFFYVKPGNYYMRMFVDENNNGIWDTGDYYADLEPEPVYYYPEQIVCKAKWDINLTWRPDAFPLNQQKPGKITKQKADKQKTIKNKNQQRAKDKGIEYTPKL